LAVFETLYVTPLPPPEGPMQVYHLGHSLVGRDMPAMLAQLAGHGYASQLGWGTSLKNHWDGGAAINGFEVENAHPTYRDARTALDSGAYDAVVLTEMVDLRDAIRYHDSANALTHWAARARAGRGDVRVYLYETWHGLDVAEGWLSRLDADLADLWEGALMRPAMARDGVGTIHLIPAGQVLARFVRALEAQGGVEGLAGRAALFASTPEGGQDMIHLNDLGAYLVALTHYAVLYHKSPVGLPRALLRADGTAADPPSPEAALLMQRTVWEVVTTLPRTGVAPAQK